MSDTPRRTLFVLLAELGWLTASCLGAQETIAVEPAAPALWAPREFELPTAATAPGGLSEASSSPFHPWLDWRMSVRFTAPSGRSFEVPGFYAADGKGGDRGSVWKVRLSPDEAGAWRARVRFEQGGQLNVQDLSVRGTALFPDGMTFGFEVGPRDARAPGFLARGPLEYVGERYLRHRDGTWFLKGGTDSPENLLGYAGFDGARDLGGLPRGASFLHTYSPHVQHWRAGDPNWSSSGDPNAGKGIIGALNYLSAQRVNSIYFLPLNLGGDGQDTFPFLDPTANDFDKVTHYDVGRMEQWNVVFEHAQRCGIQLGFLLAEQETENTFWLGTGLTTQRKLFFKNLVAMFGHHLAIKWNLCEENSAEPTDEYPINDLVQFAAYIRAHATFAHPITVHTDPDDQRLYQQILARSDAGWLTATSLQLHTNYEPQIESTWNLFAANGRKVVIDLDEQGSPDTGLTDSNHDDRRKRVLWDTYLSGANLEWYLGYHFLPLGGDMNVEDFATRREMWRFMRYARELIGSFAFWTMEPHDELVTGETVDASYGDAEVLARLGGDAIVYWANASSTGSLDLRAATVNDRFALRWFDPRNGTWQGNEWVAPGGAVHAVGAPPYSAGDDWVLAVRRR